MPDGRLYIYGSYDTSSEEYCSDQYRVVSTGDLVNWTVHPVSFHGKQAAWFGDPGARKYPISRPPLSVFGIRNALRQIPREIAERRRRDKSAPPLPLLWAPDAVEKDGTYYLYFCMSDGSEGVATSHSPEGPFTEPTRLPCAGIDPSVLIDYDGSAYYYWGQITSNGVRLGADMKSFDEATVATALLTEKKHHFHEASSVRRINDTYYYIYASVERGKPTSLSYATSRSPLGPFAYRGVIIDNDGCDPAVWNIHGSIQEFAGQWYVFYHRSSRGSRYHRRLCVEPIEIGQDGSIPEVPMTSQGLGRPFGPGEVIPAFRACALTGSARIDTDGGGGEWITQIGHRDTAVFRYVSCESGFNHVIIQACGTGTVEVLLDDQIVGRVNLEPGKSTVPTRLRERVGIAKSTLKLRFLNPVHFRLVSITLG